jgi:hypothetical protein
MVEESLDRKEAQCKLFILSIFHIKREQFIASLVGARFIAPVGRQRPSRKKMTYTLGTVGRLLKENGADKEDYRHCWPETFLP